MRFRLRDADVVRLKEALIPPPGPTPEPAAWLERATRRRLRVHTVKGETFEGTLTLNAADGLLLWSAQLLPDQGKPVDLHGEVFVPREQVLFVQTVRM